MHPRPALPAEFPGCSGRPRLRQRALASRPGRLKLLARRKRALRSHTQRGKRREHVGSLDGFGLRAAARQKRREASDERVARSRRIHRLDAMRRNMRHALLAREQRSILAQRDDHAPQAALQQVDGARAGIVQTAHRHAS